jgi:hypothetical protein
MFVRSGDRVTAKGAKPYPRALKKSLIDWAIVAEMPSAAIRSVGAARATAFALPKCVNPERKSEGNIS